MGEGERPQVRDGHDARDVRGGRDETGGRDGRDGLDDAARRAAVLGRHVAPRAQPEHDVGRERVAPDDPDRGRRNATLGRHRDIGQGRDAARSSEERRDDILGRGRDSALERGQGRNHGNRDRDRDRDRGR